MTSVMALRGILRHVEPRPDSGKNGLFMDTVLLHILRCALYALLPIADYGDEQHPNTFDIYALVCLMAER